MVVNDGDEYRGKIRKNNLKQFQDGETSLSFWVLAYLQGLSQFQGG